MNDDARLAINNSIVVIADILNVTTRQKKSQAPDFTTRDLVNFARAMTILASCLAFDLPGVSEETELP